MIVCFGKLATSFEFGIDEEDVELAWRIAIMGRQELAMRVTQRREGLF